MSSLIFLATKASTVIYSSLSTLPRPVQHTLSESLFSRKVWSWSLVFRFAFALHQAIPGLGLTSLLCCTSLYLMFCWSSSLPFLWRSISALFFSPHPQRPFFAQRKGVSLSIPVNNLLQVSKILSQLGSGTPFPSKDDFYPLNVWLETQQKPCRTFIDNILRSPDSFLHRPGPETDSKFAQSCAFMLPYLNDLRAPLKASG